MTRDQKSFLKNCLNNNLETPFNELVEMLNNNYSKITKGVIDKEKTNINTFITRNENYNNPDKTSIKYLTTQYLYKRIISYSIFDRFNKYYSQFLVSDDKIDLTLNYEDTSFYDVIMAFNLAKFYNYLDNYLINDNNADKINSDKIIKKLNKKLTIAEQMLVFNYLCGDLFNSLTNVNKAKILSFLFESDCQNIRAKYSNQHTIKTTKYLNSVLPLFKDIKFTEVVKLIEADLKKAQKRESKKRSNED